MHPFTVYRWRGRRALGDGNHNGSHPQVEAATARHEHPDAVQHHQEGYLAGGVQLVARPDRPSQRGHAHHQGGFGAAVIGMGPRRGPIRVQLADDHDFFRASLAAALNATQDIQVVAECGD